MFSLNMKVSRRNTKMDIPHDVMENVVVLYLKDKDFSWSSLYGVCKSWQSIYDEMIEGAFYQNSGNVRIFGSMLQKKKGMIDYPFRVVVPRYGWRLPVDSQGRSTEYPWILSRYGRMHLNIPNIDMCEIISPGTHVLSGFDNKDLSWHCVQDKDASPIKICKAFLRNYPLYSWQTKEWYPDEEDVKRGYSISSGKFQNLSIT